MKRMQKIISWILACTMLVGYFPVPACADDIAQIGLCEHHTEHIGCSSAPAVEQVDCGHVHKEECYVTEETCVHVHDECDMEEIPCEHMCTEEAGCIAKVLNCQHTYDSVCSFVEHKDAVACNYVCAECNRQETETICDGTLNCATDEHSEDCEKRAADDVTETADDNPSQIITLPFKDEIPITSKFVEREYEFTPTVTGTYIFTSSACELPYTDSLIIYIGNNDSGAIKSEYLYPEDDICQVRAELTAGITYIVRSQYASITVGRTAEFSVEYLEGDATVTSIQFQFDSIECEWSVQDRQYFIYANLLPAGSSGTIVWESSDSTIAEITAIEGNNCSFVPRKAGSTTITATCNGISNSVDITVNDPHLLTLNQPVSVTHDKGTMQHIFTFTPTKSGKYVFSIDSGNDHYVRGISVHTSEGSIETEPGYGEKTLNGYVQLDAGTTYYIGIGSSAYYPDYHGCTVSVAQNIEEPVSLKLRCVNESADKSQFTLGAYFTPENTHEKIVKWEVSNESVLHTYGGSSYKNTFNVIGTGSATITATSESGLTASYTYPATTDASVTSGTCGENLTWSFDETTGTLTISGTGLMGDFYNLEVTGDVTILPWRHWVDNIQHVIIQDGVSNIEEYAFYSYPNLTSISIPNSVAEIGIAAFGWNPKLEMVKLPDGIKTIKHSTFIECSSLRTVIIPETVTSLEFSAFSGCTALETITIPKNVTSIGSYAFSRCNNLSSISIPNGVTSIENHAFDDCTSLTSVTIPDSVTSIGESAFRNCSNLDSIIIPFGVTHIGKSAFYNCSSLSDISIPSSMISIDDHAFQDCTTLTSVTFPDSITELGWYIFCGCTELRSVELPDGITYLDWGVFYNCTNLKSVTLPSNLTIIYDFAFQDCTSLINIELPDTLTTIYYGAFNGCKSLTSITLPDSLTYLGDNAFRNCTSLREVTFKGSAPEITAEHGPESIVFYNVTANVYYPAGNETWNSDVMQDYGGTLIWVPYSGEIIASGTCSENLTWSLDGAGTLTISGNGAMGNYTYLVDMPWYVYSEQIKAVHIKSGITSINIFGISKTSKLNGIWVDPNNKNYSSDNNGVLFNKNKTKLIKAPNKISGEYSIPNSVTTISNSAFMDCSSLECITIPDSVTSIGDGVFYNCSSLNSITIPDHITRISIQMFYGCTSLTSVTISDRVIEIGQSAFDGCSNLAGIWVDENNSVYSNDYRGVLFNKNKTILIQAPGGITGNYIIPESVIRIADGAFRNCNGMQCISFPDGITGIGFSTFYNCDGITSIELPDSITLIDENAFNDCSNLTSVTLPSGITSIFPHVFSSCTSLKSIELPESITEICYAAFWGCTGLTSITLPDSIDDICDFAFSGCTNLHEITFAGDAPEFSYDPYDFNPGSTALQTFQNVTATVYYPDNDPTWTSDVMQNYGGTITWVPYSAEHVHEYNEDHVCECGAIGGVCDDNLTWEYDESTSTLTITGQGKLTKFKLDAWEYLRSRVKKVVVEEGITGIYSDVFSYPNTIAEIEIPASALDIEYSLGLSTKLESISVHPDNPNYVVVDGVLFNKDMTRLLRYPAQKKDSSYSIPSSVESVEERAFMEAVYLKSIEIPEGVTLIDLIAFGKCTALTEVVIPESVTNMGENVFASCTGLRSVTVAGNPELYWRVFGECTAMEEITFLGDAPNFGGRTFDNVTAIAYYPAGNDTWTEDVMQNYDGNITWVAYDPEPEVDLIDFYAANVIMGNNLDMMFALPKNAVSDWTGHYIQIQRTYANGRADHVQKIPYADWTSNGSYYVVTYKGLAAKEMCDTITLTVYNADNRTVSNPWVDSMRGYVMRQLDKASDLQKTMFVDMLNYGAEAQSYFGYGADDLANSQLTAAQKAYGSGSKTLVSTLVQGDKWKASNLILKSNIQFMVAFTGLTDDMSARVQFTGHKGNVVDRTVAGKDFGVNGSFRYILIDDLVIADARQEITITIYNTDGSVYAVCQESIQDYLARRSSVSSLFEAIMKFADSAYAYLHRND